MLTSEGCQSRRQRLWDALPESLEWVLVADPRHVLYLSNFMVQPLSFSGGERALLLLERDNGATLLGDNFAIRSAADTPHVDREVVETWYDHANSVVNRDHALFKAVASVGERLYGRTGAVEAEWLPVGAREVLGPDHESHSVSREAGDPTNGNGEAAVDLGTVIRSLRRSKEADELAILQDSIRAGEAGHARAREIIRPGVTELDVYREVQNAAVEAAGRPCLVYGDFRACTKTKPKSGGLPTDYELQDGDLFVLDYSVVLHGYRGDFTNAYAVGRPSDEQEMLFRLCTAAMAGGESAIRDGAAASDVYAATTKPFVDAGYDRLGHHAGHGIGLAHPEPPILVPDSRDTLQTGDVITIEPGLYIEGIGGIRIENNYRVTETGYDKLTNHVIALT